MKIQLLSLFLAFTLMSSLPSAFADSVSFTDDIRCIPPPGDEIQTGCDGGFGNPNDVATAILGGLGMGNDQETLAIGFTSPFDPDPAAPPGTDPASLTWTYMRDTGSFEFSFGSCPVSAITVDPNVNIQQFAEDCLNNATEIFDDHTADAGTDGTNPTPTAFQLLSGDTLTQVMPTGGVDMYFYLLPHNDLSFFQANPGMFYPAATDDNDFRAPLFSLSDANPGACDDGNPSGTGSPTDGCDQMLSFVGDCTEVTPLPMGPDPAQCTVFMFEDLSRDPTGTGFPSDEDFTDIAFIVDAAFDPIVEDPCDDPDVDLFIHRECLGGEMLQIDSSALLLAGLQSSAIWILPILLAGAGVAAFQLRRK